MTCEKCRNDTTSLVIHDKELWCWDCHREAKDPTNQAPSIIPDTFVGGIYIKHGLCNEDGTPKRWDSKSEIRRAAFEAGLTWADDTPHPNPRLVDENQARREGR